MLRPVSRQVRALGFSHSKPAGIGRRMSDDSYLYSKEARVFPKLKTGDKLGPGNRYRILKGDPLRWFTKYSLWLAHDEQEDKCVIVEAVKSTSIGSFEFAAYKCLSSRPPAIGFESTHCMHLLDKFKHFKREEVGNHYCLVSDLMGGNIKIIQKNWPHIPLQPVKRILLHVLRGIPHMHSCGVVHTDINPDNILFDAGRLDIDSIVRDPYPVVYLEDIMNVSYFLSDFVNAQCISNLGEANEFTDEDYRPPEIILQGPWNEKVDIWAFGCLTRISSANRKNNRSSISLYLRNSFSTQFIRRTASIKMRAICGKYNVLRVKVLEQNSLEQVQIQGCTSVAIRDVDRLRNNPCSGKETFTECLKSYNVLKQRDVDVTAALLERCLRVNPEDRPTAEELLKDPFWEDMDM
ncbi:hypothetical protein Clacol_008567 [Clathrus columnatus]|uniref:Protein kinase domain-containing protein n=1 Tax=Clathrus columnatus TaxID=1419009 RepID=A0AAV5AML9_9AGAM|nr:hypothetical protein Clacol_008567 [Clathrus columnatus]